MVFIRAFLVALGAALGIASPTPHAAPVKTDYVEAELVAATQALVAGGSVQLALRLKHAPGWHTYWQNPGDSGLATRIEWKLPAGFAPGPIEWPTPKRIPVPPLANFGYEGEVLLLTSMVVPQGLLPGSVTLKARADWLVCREVCLPDGADLTLTLPIVQGSPIADPRWGPAIAATRAALPAALQGWSTSATGKGDRIELLLKPPPGTAVSAPRTAYLFPIVEGLIEPARPQAISLVDGALALALPVAVQLKADAARIEGVLVTDPPLAGNARAVNVAATISGTIRAGTPSADHGPSRPESLGGGGDLGLLAALAFALLGGVILNLMPCVFPVLSIKILGFADQAHGDRRQMHGHAIAYAFGVVLSFLALAGALLGLKAAGESVGWGFQLQSPIVVALLAGLFFLLALNLSGVFEVFVPVPDAVVRPLRHPLLGSFGAGVLAVIVASPCTAPFMGAALGYAVTQGAASALAVFGALGVGMALPYVLLAWFPQWLRRLPKPGPWLARLKQLLAFPLYATVVWLAWVLGLQVGLDGMARLGAALVALGLAAWAWGNAQRGGARGFRAVAALAAAVAVAAMVPALSSPPVDDASLRDAPRTAQGDGAWQRFSREAVSDLVASGKPVFVDFTAAWCVTCQVNKKLVLDQPATVRAFAEHGVTLMRADWTRRDPEITTALTALGRNGVPVYVLYRPGKAPLVLPEVLRDKTIAEALATLGAGRTRAATR